MLTVIEVYLKACYFCEALMMKTNHKRVIRYVMRLLLCLQYKILNFLWFNCRYLTSQDFEKFYFMSLAKKHKKAKILKLNPNRSRNRDLACFSLNVFCGCKVYLLQSWLSKLVFSLIPDGVSRNRIWSEFGTWLNYRGRWNNGKAKNRFGKEKGEWVLLSGGIPR